MSEPFELAKSTFKHRATRYDEEAPWNREDRLVRPLLEALGPPSGLFLDLCAGTGFCSDIAHGEGWNVICVDASAEMLRQVHGYPRVLANAERLPLRDYCCSVVFCRQGLQYLDLDKAFLEIRRVATRVAFSHIVMDQDIDAHFWNRYFGLASPGRRTVFSRMTLLAKLREYGYSIDICEETVTRSPLLGPIRYLSDRAIRQVFALFSAMDDQMRERYDVRGNDMDLSYLNHWQLITASRDADL